MLGAFKKGIQAKREGKSMLDCPYSDKRKPSGLLSWSRAFINAWEDGFLWAKRGYTGKSEDLQKNGG